MQVLYSTSRERVIMWVIKCYMTNVKLTLFLILVNFFRPKRQAKPTADDGFWDCSVCTFRNSAEAFKCSICDVRKGTSTRYGSIDFESAKGFVCASYSTPYRLSFSCSKPPCTRYWKRSRPASNVTQSGLRDFTCWFSHGIRRTPLPTLEMVTKFSSRVHTEW